jgi:hypothetical protein
MITVLIGCNWLEVLHCSTHNRYLLKPFGRLFDNCLARSKGKDKTQSSIVVCFAVIYAGGIARNFVNTLALIREIPSRSAWDLCYLSACRDDAIDTGSIAFGM